MRAHWFLGTAFPTKGFSEVPVLRKFACLSRIQYCIGKAKFLAFSLSKDIKEPRQNQNIFAFMCFIAQYKPVLHKSIAKYLIQLQVVL